jgi:hypothetical protein
MFFVLFLGVPERDIMLTTFVYHIQPKKRKNSCRWPGVFSVTYQGIKNDTSRILSSLLKILDFTNKIILLG